MNSALNGDEASTHQEYIELCARSLAEDLSAKESERLGDHLARCEGCREVLDEYGLLVHGFASLAPSPQIRQDVTPWPQEMIKAKLFMQLAREREDPPFPAKCLDERNGSWRLAGIPQTWLRYAGAIMLLAVVVVASHHFGANRRAELSSQRDPVQTELDHLRQQREALQREFARRTGAFEELSSTVDKLKAELARSQNLERASTQSLAGLVKQTKTQASELTANDAQEVALARDRDLIARRLQDAQASIVSLQKDISDERRQRESDQLNAASLGNHIEQLEARAKQSEDTVAQQQQLLAHDRDIRELMGARDLYIADVFDVNRDGKTERPFGRIFYTKGKSLVFYAFDLTQQHGLRDVSTFQAWGRRDANSKRPLNMGIFYLDNEANKRWVLRFDDPKALAQIDAVFVTVEPKGGSAKPSGKQLLFAQIRTEPNHP